MKKGKLWLWLGIGAAVLVAAAAVALVLFGNGAHEKEDPYELYWNVDGEYYTMQSETGLTAREPDSDGVYRMRFVSASGMTELTTTDRQLVNVVDTLFVVALETNGNEIVSAEDPALLGYTVNKGLYVKSVSSGTITCNTSIVLSGMPVRVRISDQLHILDVRADAEVQGASIEPGKLDALDYVYTCSKEDQVYTHVFLAGRSQKSSIYWRADQQYNSTTKETKREPDANGVYTIGFFCDGEYVELKCKDKTVVSNIDRSSRFLCHFALEFDEEGYIVKNKLSSLGIKGMIGCSNYVVTELEEGVFTAESMSGNEAGNVYSNELDDYCVIYDASKTAKSEGRQGKPVDSLQVGDRIVVWTDTDGRPVEIYITLRLTDVPAYFNMTRRWSSYYKQTLREPDKKGYYYVELLKTGDNKPKTYKTKDKALVDLIDSRGDRTVGIRAEGDILTAVYEAECIFGYTNLGPRYVSMTNGTMFSAMAYKDENDTINGVYSMDCPIYDVSGTGKLGAKTELRVGDLVILHRDALMEIKQIYVVRRAMGVDYAYYNLERQYDTEKKVTTRQPVDGYYVFKMANKGKIVTVKTDSKELATKMDSFTPPAMGLVVKKDIVQYVFDPVNISGAVRVAYYSTVQKIDEDGTVHGETSTGIQSQFIPAKDCVYYNCSQVVKTNRGEKVSGVKVGDLITGYLDKKGEATVVFILSRDTKDIAWNTQRKYNSTTKETTREKDADGYYNYRLLIGDEVRNVRTKDRELANKIDSYDGAFGVYVEKDIICSAMGVGLVKNVAGKGVSGWDVVKLDGNKMTLRYTKPGSEQYTGKEEKTTLSKNLKVYDISPTAKVYGEEVQLKLGDRIRTYVDDDGKVLYAYVLNHVTRAAGAESYCSHCDKIVHWEPWTGTSFATADRHYYMNTDVEKTVVLSTTPSTPSTTTPTTPTEIVPYDTVLDLNGKTMTVNGSRCFTVKNGQTLTIIDSAEGGTLIGNGPVNGGVFNVQSGATLNLQSGTFKGVIEDKYKGGVVYIVAGGTVNISGTAVVDGSGVTSGKGPDNGAIYSKGTLNILGGEVKGATAGSGGSVSVADGALHISSGKVYGGAATYGDDIFVSNKEAVVTVSGGEVAGQFQISAAKSVVLSGAPKLANIKTATSTKLTLGELTTGADISVAATGAFTEASENAEAYVGYFHSTNSARAVLVYKGVLYMEEKGSYLAECSHCDSDVLWKPWKASYTESGHYFLSEKVERTVRYAPEAADIVIDLHGQEWVTTNNNRAMLINDGITVTIKDSVGTGIITAAGIEDGGVFSIKSGGTLNFDGGTAKVLSATNTLKGSIAYVMAGGALNLNGGVLDASAIQNGKGACGAVYSAGAVTISGGEIKGGSVGSGGSVNIANGSLTISGGKISGGQAENYGDDIFVNNTNAQVTISGGEVSGQFQISLAKSVLLSGAPKLNNLKMVGAKLQLGELTNGALIAVDAEGEFALASQKAKDYLDAHYFTAVNDKSVIKVTDDGILYVYTDIPSCPHCNQPLADITWTTWAGVAGDFNTSGHYRLATDYTQNGQVKLTGGDVVLDLAGHTLSTTTNRPFYVNGGTLTILDTSEEKSGKVTGKATASGAVLFVNTNGTLHIYGGIYESAATTGKDGGTVAINGAVTLHDGMIKGSTSTTAGGNIQLSKGSFTMEGGCLTAGTAATSGGTIFAKGGTLTLNGGVIESGTVGAGKSGTAVFAYRAAAATPCTVNIGSVEIPSTEKNSVVIGGNVIMNIAGAPRIGYMSINATSGPSIGEMEEGASVYLAIVDTLPLATTNPQMQAYLDQGYFRSYAVDKKLILEDNALKTVALQ